MKGERPSGEASAGGRPLRFLHLHGTFQPGGKEARAARLMNLWGDRVRHSIVVADPAEAGGRAMIAPHVSAAFPADAPSLVGKPSPGRYWRMARYMQGFDLVLTYNWGAMDAPAAHRLFRRALRLPPLIHHEDGFNESEAGGLNPKRNAWRRHMLKSAHALVVPSQALEAIALSRWRRPRAKVRQIPNGIPVDLYAGPPAPDAIPGFRRTPGKCVVGTLAGLRAVKNLPRLVRAVAAHRDRVQLVIVGEGAERAAIQREAEAQGLTDIHLPGHIADPWRFVGLFDIFALSSDSEQFPISLVEAMAAGLPAAATDVGDVAAMVSSVNRPYIVPCDDEPALSAAIGRLAQDPALRNRIGSANAALARARYSEAAMVAAYAGLYGDALAIPDILL